MSHHNSQRSLSDLKRWPVREKLTRQSPKCIVSLRAYVRYGGPYRRLGKITLQLHKRLMKRNDLSISIYVSKYISNTSQFYQNLFELLSFEDIASFDMMLSSRLQEFEKKVSSPQKGEGSLSLSSPKKESRLQRTKFYLLFFLSSFPPSSPQKVRKKTTTSRISFQVLSRISVFCFVSLDKHQINQLFCPPPPLAFSPN